MLNAIVILTAVIQGLIVLFVYQKKRDSLTNIAFGVMSLFNVAWALANYFYTRNPIAHTALLNIRFIIFLVVLQNTAFYLFARNYPSTHQLIHHKTLRRLFIFSGLVAIATLTPYVFTSVTISNNQSTPNAGPLIVLFMAHAVYTIGVSMASLIRKLRRASGQQRKQLQLIVFAALLNWGIVPITNFVITLALKNDFFARVSPFYTLAFAGIIAYAVVAQRLFDIKLIVARSVAYVLVIGTIIGIYSTGTVGVANILLEGGSASQRNLLSVGFAVVVALTFQPIKKFFDRITNKVFFQDAYDPQVLLNTLNRILVKDFKIETLISDSAKLITHTMGLEFCLFDIAANETSLDRRLRGSTDTHKITSEHLETLRHTIPAMPLKLLVAEDLVGRDEGLHDVLSRSDVALVTLLRLSSTEQFGYILWGHKKSGNPYSKQDIRVVQIVANELTIAIQNALRFEEIETFNVTLQQKVNDATRQLRHTNEKLKALDETKDEFISMASHQLRTPLTSVKGYMSMVIEGDAGKLNANQKKLLEQAFTSSQRMVYLIADLLNVSRLKTGKFVIEPVVSNLAEVIEGEVGQLIETAKAKNLELTYDKPTSFPLLELDETKIRQVIMNFIDNAVYYTPEGGHIKVSLREVGDSIEFTVEDDGIGVPKAEQHHLFNKFYRAGNAKKARPDGTGLGLFMAKKVVVAQGGSIIFRSAEGKGSTFGFSFAKSKLAPKAHAATSA